MKYFFLILFLLFGMQLFAQPGSFPNYPSNINDIDFERLKNEPELRSTLDPEMNVIIDAKSDLSRIKFLSEFTEMVLSIQLSAIPKEFGEIDFYKLRYLEIDCNNQIKDLSGIEFFNSVSSLQIKNFEGKSFPKSFANLEFLYDLQISDAPNLTDIEIVNSTKTSYLSIWKCPSLRSIFNGKENELICNLTLSGVSDKFDMESLSGFHGLRNLIVSDMNFKTFPKGMSPVLRHIRILNNKSLNSVAGLASCSKLEELWIYNCSSLRSIDTTFSLTSLNCINLSSNESLKEVNNLFYLPEINELKLENLPNLESIELHDCKIKKITIRETGIQSIDSNDKLAQYKQVEIVGNKNLDLADQKTNKQGTYFYSSNNKTSNH